MSPMFSLVLVLFILRISPSYKFEGKLDPSSQDYKFYIFCIQHAHIHNVTVLKMAHFAHFFIQVELLFL